jgi:Na+/H+ antiporter NhaC
MNLDKVPDESIRSLVFDLVTYFNQSMVSNALGKPSDTTAAARARLAEFYDQHQGTEAP